jgi:hypothetical protein
VSATAPLGASRRSRSSLLEALTTVVRLEFRADTLAFAATDPILRGRHVPGRRLSAFGARAGSVLRASSEVGRRGARRPRRVRRVD